MVVGFLDFVDGDFLNLSMERQRADTENSVCRRWLLALLSAPTAGMNVGEERENNGGKREKVVCA